MNLMFYYHGHENPPPDPLYFESNKIFTSACRSTIDEKLTVPAVTGVRDDVNRLQLERHYLGGFSLMNLLREGPNVLMKDISL
jgi:hypothetical protein